MAKKTNILINIQPNLEKIRKLQKAIVWNRDMLRKETEDLQEILENVDEMDELMTSGLRSIEDAIDALSKRL